MGLGAVPLILKRLKDPGGTLVLHAARPNGRRPGAAASPGQRPGNDGGMAGMGQAQWLRLESGRV